MFSFVFRGIMFVGGLLGAKEVVDIGSETLTGKSAFQNAAESELGKTVAQSEPFQKIGQLFDAAVEGIGGDPAVVREKISEGLDVIDHTTGQVAGAAVDTATGAVSEGWDWLGNVKEWGDKKTADFVYSTFIEPMGFVDRPTYDYWFEKIDAIGLLTTFSLIMGSNAGLKAVGLGIDAKYAAGAAIAYTVLQRSGLMDQAVAYMKKNVPADILEPEKTSPLPTEASPAKVEVNAATEPQLDHALTIN